MTGTRVPRRARSPKAVHLAVSFPPALLVWCRHGSFPSVGVPVNSVTMQAPLGTGAEQGGGSAEELPGVRRFLQGERGARPVGRLKWEVGAV